MTTVLVCADTWTGPPPGLEGTDVVMVDELCRSPRAGVSAIPPEETELVVVVHRDQLNLGSLQAALRRIGFDPLAVGVVDLGALGSLDDLPATLAGALARVRAFPGAGPEQVKLLPQDRRTRRGFLSLGTPTYTGAPRIEAETCVASRGCQVCAVRCPTGALSWSNGRIAFDVNACVACGICVTACPLGAVVNPVASPTAVAAEILAVLSHGPMAIRYRCRQAIVPAEPGWYQVEVPCTGMLTPAWLIAPRLLGAPAAEAVPCTEGGCDFAHDEHLRAVTEDATAILAALDPASGIHGSRREAASWFGPGGTAHLIDALAPPAAAVDVELTVADVGTVSIDDVLCTACERCAAICPTSALVSENGQGIRITFDPRRCLACGQCLTVCPEQGAITLTRGFDLADRRRGRRTLKEDVTPRCEICGGPVAPASMLARIAELLGAEGTATMALVERRCLDCRGR